MAGSRPGRIIGLFWLYTGLRVLVFLVLFGALWLVGVRGLLGALIALILGIPLSIFVLAAPRRRLAAALQDHVDARTDHQTQLRRRLNGDDGDDAEYVEHVQDVSALDGSHEAIELHKGPSDGAVAERDERNGGDPRANRPDAGR